MFLFVVVFILGILLVSLILYVGHMHLCTNIPVFI